MKKHIPNAITSGNLICGCIGIVQTFDGRLEVGASMILFAAMFDFFDGFAARMLKVSSEIGKQLDSLADMVSFGMLPTFIMYRLLEVATGDPVWPYLSLMLAVFAALRLAKFNIDERQATGFIGLPTPAVALVIGSLPIINYLNPEYREMIMTPWVLSVSTVLLAFLMIVDVPIVSLKFKDYSWKHNKPRYVLVIGGIILLVTLKALGIPLIVLLQVIVSIIWRDKSNDVMS